MSAEPAGPAELVVVSISCPSMKDLLPRPDSPLTPQPRAAGGVSLCALSACTSVAQRTWPHPPRSAAATTSRLGRQAPYGNRLAGQGRAEAHSLSLRLCFLRVPIPHGAGALVAILTLAESALRGVSPAPYGTLDSSLAKRRPRWSSCWRLSGDRAEVAINHAGIGETVLLARTEQVHD